MLILTRDHQREFTHLQLFSGLGGLSAGVGDATAVHYGLEGSWRPLAAIDSCPKTIDAYNPYTGTQAGHAIDLFSRQQYTDFWGHEPPPDWEEITPDRLRQLCGGASPDLVCSSPPCKGYSGLIGEGKSQSPKYQALNALAYRGVWLVLEAFRDAPPAFFLLENVSRIQTRGRQYLHDLEGLLRAYGYSVNGFSHCCGEVAGLAQKRSRYLLVARHQERVRPYLFQPKKRPLRSVGEVLGQLPMPGPLNGGHLLHMPRRTTWQTRLRLALIPPGEDWRALKRLRIEDGRVMDYVLVPERYGHQGNLGVLDWKHSAGAVTSEASPTTGAFSVGDPRAAYTGEYGQLGVQDWDTPSPPIPVGTSPGQGPYSIADPRPPGVRHNNVFRLISWDGTAPAVTGGAGPSSGGYSVAEPMQRWMHQDQAGNHRNGHFGIIPWDGHAPAVTAHACHDNGRFSVADPRLPEPGDLGTWTIVSPYGTVNQPLTTLELAVLQGLLGPEDLELTTTASSLITSAASDTQKRQWIGNAVPRPTARVLGETILRCLLAEEAGETFELSTEPVWARHLTAACALPS